ncbi:proprotein convertase subtilisin/kexin type 9 isoform X1 [Danio rerio]|uniref:Proprotein convertase subtilisin/kexin type 9 n=2 Tax=Danio rerio TaxID=7955 RepID=E7F2J6_DANRE|nr:proprotein convertase subtilisin/kexin type 9 [Danio rerio]|eukprot:XP_003200725.1 proprotein convertase subtilisin/kexin type 9 [Danio rerio]
MRSVVSVCCLGFLLGLLAVVECDEDYIEDEDEMILSLILQDDTQPEAENRPSAQFYRCTKDAWRMPGQYLVVMRNGTHVNQVERTTRRLSAKAAKRGYLIEILQTYSGAFRGFLVKMSSDVLHMAVKLPHVEYIEEDSSIFAQSIPWNLQRVLQNKHEAGKYSPPNDGAKVGVYLLDTSVQLTHREVEDRVMVTDFNRVPEEDGVRVHRQASQCDSHGTHIAGVISGRDSGVARGASVNSVRVLNCQGKGTVSGALAGLEYIQSSLASQPVSPVILLLPFVGGFSRTLNTACRKIVESGAVLIAAAGNYNDDACLYSPASEPEVITVGAVNFADQPLNRGTTGTNVGRCVDVFAPGDDIISASSDCPTCFTTKSGTSQAAAHVAGVAAVLLNLRPNSSSAEVLQQLRYHSVKQVINPESLPVMHRLTTPNMVVALPDPTSTLTGEDLLCRSVWSERSASPVFSTAVSRCRSTEEMLSCSSFSDNGMRAGERVEERDGQKECVAVNVNGGPGVFAVARCCTGHRAQCQMLEGPERGAGAECPPEHHLTGCSFSSSSGEASDSDRTLHGSRRTCAAKKGMMSYAFCCHTSTLECRLKEHHLNTLSQQVEVSCEDSWTLTACEALSRDAVIHGAFAMGNTCVVRTSGVDKDAAAIATCCRNHPLHGTQDH